MLKKDHMSNEVIKIFHNSKGSVKNNLDKWVNHAYENDDEEVNLQRNHAAGEYEPLQERNTHTLSSQKEQSETPHKDTSPSKREADSQLDEDNRVMLENLERQEDIEDIRSEYRGHIGDKR